MATNENKNPINNQDDEIDIKRIAYVLLRQWHWFMLFGLLGVSVAYFYTRLTKMNYQVSTSLIIPEKSNIIDTKNLFQGAFDQPKNNLYNQIEIISSFQNVKQTLTRLNWRTSWYEKNLFVWNGIHNDEPYDVQEAAGFVNPGGVPIYVTPIGNDQYKLSVKGIVKVNKKTFPVNFEAQGTFGVPFEKDHFKFTLLKKVNELDSRVGKYYFVFNDLNDATKSYQKRINATLKDKNSDIIQCTIEGEQPEKEAEFLNQLINVYVEGKMDFQNEAQRRSLEFINNQLAGISDSLNTAGDKFTEFRSKNKIIDLGTEGTLVMNNLKEIESERVKNQMQLDYFKNLLTYLNKSTDLKDLVSPSVVGIEDAALNSLVLKLGELYNRRQVISFSARENNPSLLRIEDELAQVRNQLKENLRNLIENATRSINTMKERQADISLQLNKLPLKEQQMINIQRQFDLTNEVYTFLLQKRAETNIALASSTPDVQIIDIAQAETATVIGLTPKIILIIGFFIGLMLPLGFILIKNFFDDRIRTQEDIENNTSLPILSNIMHSDVNSDLAVLENPKSNIAESFRTLRTNLKFMLTGPGGKVVCIHSTNPGEGKSFNSINLATILAMNDKKVLLMGADLRKPRLHKVFDVSNNHGLSTFLIGDDQLEEIIIPTHINNLSLIVAGPVPPNPAEILDKPEMQQLMEKLKNIFDYIIVDNAPVSLVTDGIIMSQLADVNIFILRYGISHKHNMELINDIAAKETINHVALVVNDIKSNAFGYNYYKYYEYESYRNTYYHDEEKSTKKRRKKKTTA